MCKSLQLFAVCWMGLGVAASCDSAESEPVGAPDASGTASSRSSGAPSTELGDVDEPAAVQRGPVWAAVVDIYGVERASISFVEGGQVAVHIWQSAGFADVVFTFDAAGARASNPRVDDSAEGVADAVAVSADGRFHVVESEGRCGIVVDGTDVAEFGDSCGGGYGFSPDGSFVSQVACVEGNTLVRVFDVRNRVLTHEKALPLVCGAGLRFPTPPIIVTDGGRSRTIFSSPEDPRMFVYHWTEDVVREVAVHDGALPPEPAGTGTVLNLSLSEDGAQLASIGRNDGLAVLDADTYEVTTRRSTVPYYTLFAECDCRTILASVIAWSKDGRYFATSGDAGGIDVRETDSQRRVATLSAPQRSDDVPTWSSTEGPVLVQFSPDGEALIALYPGQLVGYDVQLP